MILETNMIQQHLSAVWKDWKIAGKLGNGTYGANSSEASVPRSER